MQGGGRAAAEMRTQRLSRGLLVTAQRGITDAGWQVTRGNCVETAALYGNSEAVRMEELCLERHGCYLIDRWCLQPQRTSGTLWDKVPVALKKSVSERKSISVVLRAILKRNVKMK